MRLYPFEGLIRLQYCDRKVSISTHQNAESARSRRSRHNVAPSLTRGNLQVRHFVSWVGCIESESVHMSFVGCTSVKWRSHLALLPHSRCGRPLGSKSNRTRKPELGTNIQTDANGNSCSNTENAKLWWGRRRMADLCQVDTVKSTLLIIVSGTTTKSFGLVTKYLLSSATSTGNKMLIQINFCATGTDYIMNLAR